MSLKPLTTDEDLKDWCKKLHIPLNFIGFKDELKTAPIKPGGYIVNLASSTDSSGGTHWIGFYLAPMHQAFYFDSFGAPALDEAMSVMKHWTGNMENIHINPYDIQNISQGMCGQYVIDFLANIMRQPTLNGFRGFLKKFNLFQLQKNREANI